MSRLTDAYKGPGEVLDLASPYARDGGQGALVGAIFGVAQRDLASGEVGPFARSGEYELAKLSTDAWTKHVTKLYWDDSNKRLDVDSTVGPFVAVATETKGTSTSTGTCVLVGAPQVAAEGAQANIAALTAGVNITAATANGVLTDSSATNPTDAQFNELAKEFMTKTNAIIAALVTAGILKAP